MPSTLYHRNWDKKIVKYMERKSEESEGEEVPEWVKEAWDYLVRKELGLRPKKPLWLDLPSMMRMVVTTPNVLKNQRPDG